MAARSVEIAVSVKLREPEVRSGRGRGRRVRARAAPETAIISGLMLSAASVLYRVSTDSLGRAAICLDPHERERERGRASSPQSVRARGRLRVRVNGHPRQVVGKGRQAQKGVRARCKT